LGKCSANISAACANPPTVNSTQATACSNAIGNLTAGVTNCTNLNGTAACACWKDPALANLSATVATCDISAINKNMTSFKASCQASYSQCKTLSNTAPNLISSCNSNSAALLGKLSDATANVNALNSLQTKTNALLSAKYGKRQALSCGGFADQIKSVGKMAKEAPGSSKIASTASSAVARAPSACAGADLALLSAAASILTEAINLVVALVASIQANLASLTGTTASAAAISAASSAAAASTTTAAGTVTTQKPAGLRRLGIRQIFNRNKLA